MLSVLLLFENCGDEDPAPEPNKAPTCSISSPSNNSSAALGTTVKISVSASDVDGSVSNVKISIDDVNAATLTSPYTYDWNTSGASPGQHTIKAVATDNGGLTANAQITVTVTADAPVVTTADVTEVTGTTATSGGNVTDDGGVDVTARGVVWGEASGPTVESNVGKTEDGTGTGAFTSSITGLSAGTTYYLKAYAANSQGTAYGEEKSFMTAGLPIVTTGSTISDISSSSATGSGEVTDDGGSAVTARGLVWSSANNQVTLDNSEGSTTEGTGTGTFNSNMASLVRSTEYWVRAYATNGAGSSYGDVISFKTLPEAPTVVTSDITDIIAHVARGGGEVTDDGGDPYFSTGLVWSSSPNPEYGTNEGFFISVTNPFDTLITGLESETMYYVRAWAQNAEGSTVYGAEKTFTTGTFSVTTGSFTDSRDSKVYNTVTIGDLTWMAENLAYLPEVCASDAECGYWVYDYTGTDVSAAKATSNYSEYGVLYNFETAKDACPAGWHLPSDYEWSYLEVYLGMSITATIGEGPRGTNQGGKMKGTGTVLWNDPNTGATNISGFTALPGGMRDNLSKTFSLVRSNALFWSSTKEGNWANYRYLTYDSEQAGSDWLSTITGSSNSGGSVRCVKD